MFIKRGDGKILSVIDEETLEENAKKLAKSHSDKLSNQEADESNDSSKSEK